MPWRWVPAEILGFVKATLPNGAKVGLVIYRTYRSGDYDDPYPDHFLVGHEDGDPPPGGLVNLHYKGPLESIVASVQARLDDGTLVLTEAEWGKDFPTLEEAERMTNVSR